MVAIRKFVRSFCKYFYISKTKSMPRPTLDVNINKSKSTDTEFRLTKVVKTYVK